MKVFKADRSATLPFKPVDVQGNPSDSDPMPCFVRCQQSLADLPQLRVGVPYRVRTSNPTIRNNITTYAYQLDGFTHNFRTDRLIAAAAFSRYVPCRGDLVHVNGSQAYSMLSVINYRDDGKTEIAVHGYALDKKQWVFGGRYVDANVEPVPGLRMGLKGLENFGSSYGAPEHLVIDDPDFEIPEQMLVDQDSTLTTGDRARLARLGELLTNFHQHAALSAQYAEEYHRETGQVIPGSQVLSIFSKTRR